MGVDGNEVGTLSGQDTLRHVNKMEPGSLVERCCPEDVEKQKLSWFVLFTCRGCE